MKQSHMLVAAEYGLYTTLFSVSRHSRKKGREWGRIESSYIQILPYKISIKGQK